MICEEAMGLMSASLDGALTPAEEEALAAHLAVCPACAELMKTLRGLDEQVSALREPAPEGLKQGVLYRIDQATGKAKTPRRGWFGPGAALGAVAAVLVLLVGLKVFPLQGAKSAAPAEERYGDAVATKAACETNAASMQSYECAPEAAADGMKGVHNGVGADGIHSYSGGYTEAQTAAEERPFSYYVTEADEAACTALSKDENAAVLLYTQFTPESLFALLEAEEPQLYATVAGLEPETRDGLLCYKTDCGTIFAIQEWLMTQIPDYDTPEDLSAGTALTERMEALDPGSASLYRIITWPVKPRDVHWPQDWPDDWVESLRWEQNWRLFFPSEDYVPNADKAAYLVFPEN